MDFGVKGYNDTVEALNNAKIDFFGCSDNKYKILEKNNIRVALLSFTNNEFSIKSGHEGKGAYPIDLIDILQTLESVKEITDNIIIILHTGLSKFPLPSPEQKKLCRFLIDQGATSVLCQHSHVIGAYEYYKDGFISYGQGSFVFDGMRRNSYMNKGYSLLFTFKPKSMDVDIIPHKQFDDLPLVRTLREEEFEVFKDEVGVYNKILQNEKLFKKEWSNYLSINRKYYFNQFFLPKNRIAKKVLRNLSFEKLIRLRVKMMLLSNIRNDEHREVLIHLLNK